MSIEAARLKVHVGADTSEAEAGLNRVSGKMTSMAGGAAMAGTALTAGLTVPLLKMGGAALGTAMDYQASMNLFQAVSGATAEEMAAVSEKAKQLGADMTLPATSAADAGLAMTELAKAGLSVNDVLAASKGVLAMSAAGQLSNAAAAEITANALNAFSLEGSEAINIADMFAAAANASSAEVSDLGDAFKMSAAVFASAGQTVAGLTTSIALMSNAGIQGSDAGTSLKQMILSLQAPTDKAAALMADLGVSVYDAQGNMLPMREIVAQFSTQLAGLTQEQRNAALATIFGSDAVRAANVVLMGGVDAWDEMREAVAREDAAAELAGAHMKGLKGVLAGIQSQVETAGLVLMERFLPPLEALGLKVAGLVDWFMQLDPNIQNAVLAFLAITAAVGPVLLGIAGLAVVLGTVMGPILLVTAGVAALAAAFAGNLFGIRDIVSSVIGEIVPRIVDGWNTVVDWASQYWPRVQAIIETVWGAIQAVVNAVISHVVPFIVAEFGKVVAWVNENWPLIQRTIETVLNAILTVVEFVVGTVRTFWETNHEAILKVASLVWDNIKTVVDTAINLVLGMLKAVMQIITGDWEAAWLTIQGLLESTWASIQRVVENTLAIILTIIGDTLNRIVEAVRAKASDLLAAGAALIQGLKDGIAGAAQGVIDAVVGVVNDAIAAAKRLLGIQSPSTVFKEIGRQVVSGLTVGIDAEQETPVKAIERLIDRLLRESTEKLSALGEALRGVGEGLAGVMSALLSVGGYESGKLREVWGRLTEDLEFIVAGLQVLAEFYATASAPSLRSAKAVSDAIKPAVDGIVSIVDALTAVNTYEAASNMAARWAALETNLNAAIAALARIAANFSTKALDAAREFALSAGEAVSILGDAVANLNAVAEFKDIADFGAKMKRLADLLGVAVLEILRVRWWRQSIEAWAQAGEWATAVGPAIRLIADGVEAVNSVAALARQEGNFARNVERLADMLGVAVLAMLDVRNWRQSIETWAAASEWAVAVGPAVNLIAGAVEAVSSLANLPAITDFGARIARFREYLGLALTALIEIATGTPDALWTAAQLFAEKVGGAIGLIADAVDALTRLSEWGTETLTPAKIDTFMDVLRYTAEMFGWVSYQVSPVLLAAAQHFAADTSGVFAAMTEALQFLSDLAAAALPSEDKVKEFISTLQRILGAFVTGVSVSAGIAVNAGAIADNLAAAGFEGAGGSGMGSGTGRLVMPPHPTPYMPWDVTGRPTPPSGGGGGGGGGSASDNRLAELLTQIRDVTVEIAEKMGITTEDFTTGDLLQKLTAVRA